MSTHSRDAGIGTAVDASVDTAVAVAVAEAPAGHAAPDDGKRRRRLIVLAIIGVLLLIVTSLFAWYLITRKPITAIPILSRESMPHYNYSIYGVTQPLGVAVSPDGERVYVTQSGGTRTVLEFDHSGHVLATLTPPKSAGAAHVPVYIAINPQTNDVYVTDRMTSAIYVYTANGTYLRTFKPTGLTGSWAPLGITFASDGVMYVTEVGGKSHRILVIDPTGKVAREVVGADQPMTFPNGIGVSPDGIAVVADGNNGRLLAFDPDGKLVGAVNRGIGEGDLGLPRGVAFDDSGRVYVVDTTNQTVHVYRLGDKGSNTITFVGAFGDEGVADGLFEYPNGIATDTRSDIYITDRENGRVQVWSY